jgi:hypothetical protein
VGSTGGRVPGNCSHPAASRPDIGQARIIMPDAAVLGALGIKEWAKAERREYMALLDYTKE